jgi:preprotein translocase subunit SecF
MDYRKIFIISSLILILSSVLLLSFKGLNLGIDFKGGTLIEISTKNSDIAELRRILSPNFNDVSLQEFGNSETIIIRLQNETNVESIETVNQVKNLINDKVSEFRRSEFVGPTISSELLWKGLQAISFALLAILTYIWLRFDWQFGFGAVVALSHDVLFTLGVLSLFNIDFSLSSIAAILTICGYSLNDSVVIYDRIRENLRKYKKLELSELFNVSINNTLSRTIMTSLTTLIALFSLYIFGGEVIKPFAFAMIIGVIIGTYSSIYIAVPTLLIFKFRPQEEDNKLI